MEFVNLAGVATALFDVSELVALVEAVTLSELTTEDVTEVDATATVELATEVDAAVVTASELCGASDVDTAGALAFATSLVATGAETVELGAPVKPLLHQNLSCCRRLILISFSNRRRLCRHFISLSNLSCDSQKNSRTGIVDKIFRSHLTFL